MAGFMHIIEGGYQIGETAFNSYFLRMGYPKTVAFDALYHRIIISSINTHNLVSIISSTIESFKLMYI